MYFFHLKLTGLPFRIPYSSRAVSGSDTWNLALRRSKKPILVPSAWNVVVTWPFCAATELVIVARRHCAHVTCVANLLQGKFPLRHFLFVTLLTFSPRSIAGRLICIETVSHYFLLFFLSFFKLVSVTFVCFGFVVVVLLSMTNITNIDFSQLIDKPSPGEEKTANRWKRNRCDSMH